MGLLAQSLYEMRSGLATPEKWLVDWFGGGTETNTGERVDEETALTFSAFFCGVRLKANWLKSMPLQLFRRLPNGNKKLATDHSLYFTLHDRVNPRMTSARWRETSEGHRQTWGNAYSLIDFGRDGSVRGLHLLRPDRMRIEVEGRRLIYLYTPSEGPEKRYRWEQIFHVPGLGYDGVQGYSVVSLARQSIGMGLGTEKFGQTYFKNGAHLGGIASIPGKLSKEKRDDYRESFAKKYVGLGKDHQMLFMEEDFKFTPLTIPMDDAQFLGTKTMNINDMARWLGLPPHKLKELTHATFSNIEELNIEVAQDCIAPDVTTWESELSLQLLRKDEVEAGLFFEFNMDGLLRGNIESRYNAYGTAIQNGFMEPNAASRKENLPSSEFGDQRFIALNMQTLEQASQPRPEPQPPPNNANNNQNRSLDTDEIRQVQAGRLRLRIRNQYSGLFKDAVGRIVRREVNKITGAVNKFLKNDDITGFNRFVDQFYPEHSDYVRKNLLPVVDVYSEAINRAASQEIGKDPLDTPEFRKLKDDYTTVTTDRYIDSSTSQLRQIIEITEDDKVADAVLQRVNEWEEKRPDKISLRETVDGDGAFAGAVFLTAGFDLVWRNQGESDCPACTAMDGRKVGRGGFFTKPGDKFDMGEGVDEMVIQSSKTHPQLHGGCDCMITAG